MKIINFYIKSLKLANHLIKPQTLHFPADDRETIQQNLLSLHKK